MSAWTSEHVAFLVEHRLPERLDLEYKEALPASTYAVRASFPPAELPAKIQVSWPDDGVGLRQTLVVVT